MYSQFASEFSNTRYKPWPCVVRFLQPTQLTHPQTLLEAGCGNGRNLLLAKAQGYITEGFDICPEFVDICKSRGLDVYQSSITTSLKKTYDKIICIAVVHHLTTEEDRLQALSNIYNALNPDGELLVTMWSYETEYSHIKAKCPKTFTKGGNTVMWKATSARFYYIYDYEMLQIFLENFHKQHPDSTVQTDWEEQNWCVRIIRPAN
jgi:SAM-dependent methyltransferase